MILVAGAAFSWGRAYLPWIHFLNYFEQSFDQSYIGAFGNIKTLKRPFMLRKPLLNPVESLAQGATYESSAYLLAKGEVFLNPKVLQLKENPSTYCT